MRWIDPAVESTHFLLQSGRCAERQCRASKNARRSSAFTRYSIWINTGPRSPSTLDPLAVQASGSMAPDRRRPSAVGRDSLEGPPQTNRPHPVAMPWAHRRYSPQRPTPSCRPSVKQGYHLSIWPNFRGRLCEGVGSLSQKSIRGVARYCLLNPRWELA